MYNFTMFEISYNDYVRKDWRTILISNIDVRSRAASEIIWKHEQWVLRGVRNKVLLGGADSRQTMSRDMWQLSVMVGLLTLLHCLSDISGV